MDLVSEINVYIILLLYYATEFIVAKQNCNDVRGATN